ncbi:MAG: DUF885 domain-containing protein [Candidatus Kariarchaeaceae archaeon]|jgi:hypothetical protein
MYDDIIKRWKTANPILCHGLGLHEYDGRLPNFTSSYIHYRIQEIKDDISYLLAIREPEGKHEKYEYNLIYSALRTELFQLDVEKEFLVSPIPYIGGWFSPIGVIETSYTARSFASIDERVESITKIEEQLPSYLETAQKNLEPSLLAKPKVEMGIHMISGYISYFTDELIGFVTQAKNEHIIGKWSDANANAIAAMKQFRSFLETKLSKSHDNFALGEENFLALLEFTEGVKISADKLIEIGEADLKKNYDALLELVKNSEFPTVKDLLEVINNDYPEPNELISYVEEALERIKSFILVKDIVTVPSESQPQVIYTPKSLRKFSFAAMNTPGPFEVPEASEAYYWVTPPDPNWSSTRIQQYMQILNKSNLEDITVHEAWPGHFLQLLYNNQIESEIVKLYAQSITMIEGWAHYAEEMIYELGYDSYDRQKYRAGQLLWALIRNVRFLSAVKMHCKGMPVEESKRMFIKKGFMSEPTAAIEANRGTVDPMYLNYTLGKLLIKKLLEDYKQENKDSFTLKSFHDELLGYGSPPITLLRKMMLKQSGTNGNIL